MIINQEPILLKNQDEFFFSCQPRVSCFNACCRDLNQALTPYDVLRLRQFLGITFQDFLHRYASIATGPVTGLPVVTLRFSEEHGRACPFVGPDGCSVYPARPSSCRLYPLARGVSLSRVDGSLREQYALIREPHCLGFTQDEPRRVSQWIADQGLAEYNRHNDRLLELISLKNRLRPGPLGSDHQLMAQLALYDLDELRRQATDGELELPGGFPAPPPLEENDEQWLTWSMQWIRRSLFGARHATGRSAASGPQA